MCCPARVRLEGTCLEGHPVPRPGLETPVGIAGEEGGILSLWGCGAMVGGA